MHERARILVAIGLIAIAACASASEPIAWSSVGRAVDGTYVAGKDITVFPNGAGLPRGRGSVEDGRRIFLARCAGCHGNNAEGSDAFPPLAGGRGSLGLPDPLLTVGSYWPFVTTLWDYTRRAMPYGEAGSLSTNDVYAVTAFVLHLNGIVPADSVLDEKSLVRVEMPNRHGFVPDARPDTRGKRR